jgi:TPR repeat protein
MLSWMLLEGEIAEPDYAEARRFAEAAAEQGIPQAMTRLGMLYHNALGVERDQSKAAMWWRRGAERGDADGQAMLGAALHLGAGLPRDPLEACAWLLRAEQGRSPLAGQFLSAARESLDRPALAEAERRAALPLEPPP